MKFFIYFLFAIGIVACSLTSRTESTVTSFIAASSDSVRITGRVNHAGDSTQIYWPGTTILMRFTGTGIRSILFDEKGENYFNVIVDGDSLRYFKLGKQKQPYVLAENLPPGEHTVQLIKRTEWDKGSTWFYGFQIDEGDALPLPEPNKRVIEFFGNSITAGYAVEDRVGDSPDSIYTNNYYSYAALTARHFNADLYCTVKSGIGITVSWFPLIMPEMYDRLDPNNPESKWDFKKVTPHVVVINLFQNDSWLVQKPDHPSFIQRFGRTAPDSKKLIQAYRDFVANVRLAYPKAYIICALGSMDATKEGSPWPGYVTEAVNQLADDKILTHFFPFMNKPAHPKKEDQQVMAESLISFIEDNISW